jgi:hypothetical protein
MKRELCWLGLLLGEMLLCAALGVTVGLLLFT